MPEWKPIGGYPDPDRRPGDVFSEAEYKDKECHKTLFEYMSKYGQAVIQRPDGTVLLVMSLGERTDILEDDDLREKLFAFRDLLQSSVSMLDALHTTLVMEGHEPYPKVLDLEAEIKKAIGWRGWDPNHTTDPVFQEVDGAWWFWDEVWADKHGPFKNETVARVACRKYAETL